MGALYLTPTVPSTANLRKSGWAGGIGNNEGRGSLIEPMFAGNEEIVVSCLF